MAAGAAVASTAAATEANSLAIALEAGLANMGVGATEELLDLWDDLPINATVAQTSRWLDSAMRVILARRSISRDLGIAYYRLVRGLRTGTTIPDPHNPIPESTTSINRLRDAFELLAAETEGRKPHLSKRPDRDIPVDDLPDIGAQAADREKEIAQEIRDQLMAAGPGMRDKRLKKIKPETPVETADPQREAIRQDAGVLQGRVGDRMVKDGAREYISDAAEDDPRAIGYARITDGDPCPWCAMLASRGAVYKSEQSASTRHDSRGRANRNALKAVLEWATENLDPSAVGEIASRSPVAARRLAIKLGMPESIAPAVERAKKGQRKQRNEKEADLYHAGCCCHVEPVFSKEEYDHSDTFSENRKYADLWKKSKGGSAFDDLINAERRAARSSGQTTT